jgi:hypothetical protein
VSLKLGGRCCDRCKGLICGLVEMPPIQMKSKNKKTVLDFCSEACRTIFFKGRTYMRIKNTLMKENRKREHQTKMLTRYHA